SLPRDQLEIPRHLVAIGGRQRRDGSGRQRVALPRAPEPLGDGEVAAFDRQLDVALELLPAREVLLEGLEARRGPAELLLLRRGAGPALRALLQLAQHLFGAR